jgi:hypothetical protein
MEQEVLVQTIQSLGEKIANLEIEKALIQAQLNSALKQIEELAKTEE